MEIDLTTPALLFSAISLIMLAYTNRFLSYAQLVRTLKEQYMENPSSVKAAQIANLRKRLYLTRAMQVAGIGSLLLCVVSWIFPAGSRDPYFAFVGVVATLSLAGTLVRQHAMTAQQTAETEKAQSAQSTESTESARSQAKSPEPTQEKSAEELLFRAVVGHAIRARVLQITTSVTMVVAVWTCALWLAFGMQPKLAIAILLGSTVLSVAGLVLQAYDRQVTNR